mmetsp:Transcript_46488/g.123460  ORF Transcript_46488/g.123460 Transcript_46488/m.123460 type:complete len:248 (+) Transcript_46488:350-1093(+)
MSSQIAGRPPLPPTRMWRCSAAPKGAMPCRALLKDAAFKGRATRHRVCALAMWVGWASSARRSSVQGIAVVEACVSVVSASAPKAPLVTSVRRCAAPATVAATALASVDGAAARQVGKGSRASHPSVAVHHHILPCFCRREARRPPTRRHVLGSADMDNARRTDNASATRVGPARAATWKAALVGARGLECATTVSAGVNRVLADQTAQSRWPACTPPCGRSSATTTATGRARAGLASVSATLVTAG